MRACNAMYSTSLIAPKYLKRAIHEEKNCWGINFDSFNQSSNHNHLPHLNNIITTHCIYYDKVYMTATGCTMDSFQDTYMTSWDELKNICLTQTTFSELKKLVGRYIA